MSIMSYRRVYLRLKWEIELMKFCLLANWVQSASSRLRIIVVLLRQGLRLTYKHSAAKYLTTETIPLHNYERPNWVLSPPPHSNTVVDLVMFKLKFYHPDYQVWSGTWKKHTIFEGRVLFVTTWGNILDSDWKCGWSDELDTKQSDDVSAFAGLERKNTKCTTYI